MRHLLIICAMLCLSACLEQREPLSRGQVLSVAANRVDHLELGWGQPLHGVPPDGPDPVTGKLYWQVAFADADDGSPRVMLVNPYSGWARPAPADTILRSMLHPVTPAEVARSQPVRGTWILVLDEFDAAVDAETIAAEVAALNQTALDNSLYPLFAHRPLADGGSQLVYGWHAEGGIPRIHSLPGWMEQRLGRAGRWVDLADIH